MDSRSFFNSLKPTTMTLGLERIQGLLEALNYQDPKNHILIAGTNGKGSTGAILASLLQSMGYRVGLFTSPHLISEHERIRINGKMIEEGDLQKGIGKILSAFSTLKVKPTYFETLTALALLYFQENQTDFNVLEVGLGGRLDATNVVDAPYAAITPIGRDHMRILGSHLAQIAREKAGIFKKGQKVVMAPQRRVVREVLKQEAKNRGSFLVEAAQRVTYRIKETSSYGSLINFQIDHKTFPAFLPLIGTFQVENAQTALALVNLIEPATVEVMQHGLSRVFWPGRLQRFSFKGKTFFIDGTHNALGWHKVRKSLEKLPDLQVKHVIFGVLKEKTLVPSFFNYPLKDATIHLVPFSHPRSLDWSKKKSWCQNGIQVHLSWKDALKVVMQDSGDCLITGSIYLAGEILQWLKPSPWDLTTRASL